MNIVIFEDQGVRQLFPITTGRPAYDIHCGSFRLVDWLGEMRGRPMGLVRPYLETLQLQDVPQFHSGLSEEFPLTWLVNARLVPSVSNIRNLIDFKDRAISRHGTELFRGSWVATRQGWSVASALIATRDLLNQPQPLASVVAAFTENPQPSTLWMDDNLHLFGYPHEVVDYNVKTIHENLQRRIASGHYHQQQPGVFFGRGVTVSPQVVFDASAGPVVVDDNANLGPFSLLRGPVYLGPNARLSEYASVKDHVCIGRYSKIGGEVEASVVESFTNKQHHGFLGHSYIGSWVNLGAGTCNSDLKNTYGIVNVEYGDRKVSSQMQFFGCVVGDYVKTAINTSIFTGKIVGTASMVYGFATTNVPSFVNYARTFNGLGNLPAEVIVATQARMFARRNVQQRPCDIQLIHDMYRVTAHERPEGLSDTPLSL
jgi:UDP-N-acetylglucosamine diphosphorylase / glucose-1-phosphate thymidylyltransferase / UDP-N-acetylgalactosamine diphosphorylase / glucosamine-1-phosphate N-acetyltransferase / galactosamine-1-phosphate N-acetyltransferase